MTEDLKWICGKHWRHVSATKKARMRLAYRRWIKTKDKNGDPARRWAKIWWDTLGKACHEAIQAAVGIG
jgi:hypothetical protein